ncbi:MAG: hypothetical protein WDN25_13895 [Acetobacteraceae bacterium]
MAAANASARGQRSALLASPLRELSGLFLAVDCREPGCRGERRFAIVELAAFYQDLTLAQTLLRMRCADGCGGPVAAAWLETGQLRNKRAKPRRVALRGPDVRD